MKSLNGVEIAGYMKKAQAQKVRTLRANKIIPKLVIIRDNDNPVIAKYVQLKKNYGEDIGVEVEDWCQDDIESAIKKANEDQTVQAIIVQLPLKDTAKLEFLNKINPEKDVDGLNEKAKNRVFDSATATAINWLLAGYDIKLQDKKIVIVGHGKLVGAPLAEMWKNSRYDVTIFGRESDKNELVNFDVIVSATGCARLIKSEMVKSGAVIVDAGTASEDGVLVGDVDDEVRERNDIAAITPKIGGVGPLTIAALFEHVLMAAEKVVD